MLVGVDIGGTFTDLVRNVDGEIQIHKLFSTPQPADGMLAGLATISPERLTQVAHGSTVATNAILERKGARTALITTQGFRDILAIGRQNRLELYALQPKMPPSLIPRQWCFEVPERLDHNGDVLTPLDMNALDQVLDAITVQKLESVAVCFLYSYVNPVHEQAVRTRILDRGLFTSEQIALSHEVLPEFREYERASTVALEAYVRPVMNRYLQHVEEHLPAGCTLRIMKSDGGVINAETVRKQAIQTALSGPAAGVIGAFHLAKLAGYDHIITLDIGGTSTDVSLCPGRPIQHPERAIDGLPLRIRQLDIETIGAGGGSIARIDAGGALRVGPESAGADPGSIIYGRGGQKVTISDAHAILGRLDEAHFLGGRMRLDIVAARRFLQPMAAQMDLSIEQAALGIIQIANVNINRALQRVSVARGFDPRDFTLVAFGGAGPLHACEVAEPMSIPRVLIPRYPGVLCAFGLLTADIVRDYSQSVLEPLLELTPPGLQERLNSMATQAAQDLQREGADKTRMLFNTSVDMRYEGQAYELSIPFSFDLRRDFQKAYRQRYGRALEDRAIEVVTLRLQAVGVIDKPVLKAETPVEHDGTDGLIGEKEAVGSERLSRYERERLHPGARFSGPALIFQLDSTVFIPPNWSARVDAYRNLVLERR